MPNVIPYSIYFDGSGDDVTTSYIVPVSSFSCAFWYKPVSADANDRVIDSQDAGPNNGFQFYHASNNDANVTFGIRNGGTTEANIAATGMQFNQWHFIVGTYSSNNVKYYVNGVLQGTDTSCSMTVNTTGLVIGKRLSSASNYVTGYVANVMVFDYVLRFDDVKRLQISPVPPLKPNFWLRMTEGSGSTITDASGNGKNGTITNAIWSTDTPIPNSRNPVPAIRKRSVISMPTYLSFDGSNDYIDLNANNIVPDDTGNISFVAWVYRNGKGIRMVIGNRRDSTSKGVNFKIADKARDKVEFTFFSQAPASQGWISDVTVPEGRWSLIGCTYNGSTCKFYIDGNEDEKETLNTTANIRLNDGDNIRIGHRVAAGSSDEWFNGFMAHVAVYSTVLTESDYRSMYIGNAFPTTSLLGYWKLNEGSGTSAVDYSGVGNTGTINGPTWVTT